MCSILITAFIEDGDYTSKPSPYMRHKMLITFWRIHAAYKAIAGPEGLTIFYRDFWTLELIETNGLFWYKAEEKKH